MRHEATKTDLKVLAKLHRSAYAKHLYEGVAWRKTYGVHEAARIWHCASEQPWEYAEVAVLDRVETVSQLLDLVTDEYDNVKLLEDYLAKHVPQTKCPCDGPVPEDAAEYCWCPCHKAAVPDAAPSVAPLTPSQHDDIIDAQDKLYRAWVYLGAYGRAGRAERARSGEQRTAARDHIGRRSARGARACHAHDTPVTEHDKKRILTRRAGRGAPRWTRHIVRYSGLSTAVCGAAVYHGIPDTPGTQGQVVDCKRCKWILR
jgi:hypothetical protein